MIEGKRKELIDKIIELVVEDIPCYEAGDVYAECPELLRPKIAKLIRDYEKEDIEDAFEEERSVII